MARGTTFQTAIDAAQPGDTILLTAGSTFIGNFTLPAKSGTDLITIRSDADDARLPGGGGRMSPDYAAQLPKLRSGDSSPAPATAPGAHHYLLLFLEFQATTAGAGDIITLGDGSAAQSTLDVVPHGLTLDRVYIHGDAVAGQKRAIALNSASTTISNSYIADIKAVGQDSQAICGWNGPGPYTIVINYLEAAGENAMFGGSDPYVPNLVPSDITFPHNYLSKPMAWRSQAWTVKNIFELKNAQRIRIDGNALENNRLGARSGYAVLLTPRNQDGTAPWSVVQDVQFTNNIVRHVSSAVNILGSDNLQPSRQANAIKIENNLFVDVSAASYGGSRRLLQISSGADIIVNHNTAIVDGSSAVWAYAPATTSLTFTNNIIPDNEYGIIGDGRAPGTSTISTYFPGSEVRANIFAGGPGGRYPAANYTTASMDTVCFVDYAGGTYSLDSTSACFSAATNGSAIGCNIDAITSAIAGVVPSTPEPAPAPPPLSPPAPPGIGSGGGAAAGGGGGSSSPSPAPGELERDAALPGCRARRHRAHEHARHRSARREHPRLLPAARGAVVAVIAETVRAWGRRYLVDRRARRHDRRRDACDRAAPAPVEMSALVDLVAPDKPATTTPDALSTAKQTHPSTANNPVDGASGLAATAAHGALARPWLSWSMLTAPSSPMPADGAIVDPDSAVASWSGSAVTFDVYAGTTSILSLVASGRHERSRHVLEAAAIDDLLLARGRPRAGRRHGLAHVEVHDGRAVMAH